MKKLTIIFVLILLICKCNNGSSSSSSTNGLKLNPTTLPVTDEYYLKSPRTLNVNTITFGSNNIQVNYAVIYAGTVNSIGYIGIAMSDDPSNQTFNLKIYYQGTSIPDSPIHMHGSDSDLTAKVKAISGGATYTWQSGSETLIFDSFIKTDIPTNNSKTYTTYTISISGTATLVNTNDASDTKTLSFPGSITAILASTD